jgi:ankyrin repeat protein
MTEKPSLTRLLLDAGANVNSSRSVEDLEESNFGFGGPLSASIRHKQDGLLSLLIDSGADVNARGRKRYGESRFVPLISIPLTWLTIENPLQEAVRQNDEEAFRILLEKGANVNQLGGHNGW